MASAPLVSIIIPCFNYGKFLSDALDSALAQTYSNWECIVVNDGSTDNSEVIGRKYENSDSRFKYIYQENAGHSAARNTALKASKGKYIQFLDADDMLENEKLNLQVALMEENTAIDLVYSDILGFLDKDPTRKLTPANFFTQPLISGKGEALIANLIPTNFFLPGCVMMRRIIYEKVGTMKASYGFEDWEYFFRIAFEGFSFYHDPREGVRLLSRTHGNNTTHKGMEMIKSKIVVRKEIIKVTNNYLKENKLNLSQDFIQKLQKEHKKLLIADQAVSSLYAKRYFNGIKFLLLDTYYSGKPFHALSNGLRWTYYGLKKAFG
ncbi:glycosyltransferase family 2 protein [Mucilaginibacter arboris]|uniref:Glycosyltransferase n=1 Tax=Mucilaginibacter arboris TaxID=2682090 RepID=A0A7K1SV14_9SPHI|nr:glycosyltransferase family A protein [Mucilaginibacter arboris]MVN21124.1 glycosyltransferase [Mucilaginibacter arboris]